jgi:two-component system response regulator YesN
MRILLADDSSLILERLQEMISNYRQIEVVGALKNGTDVLEALKNLKPDLAIVDIKMPGLSGLEVLKEVRKINKTIIFIILTFYPSDYYRRLAIDYFFSKVDDFEKIPLVIAELIGKDKNNKKSIKPILDF